MPWEDHSGHVCSIVVKSRCGIILEGFITPLQSSKALNFQSYFLLTVVMNNLVSSMENTIYISTEEPIATFNQNWSEENNVSYLTNFINQQKSFLEYKTDFILLDSNCKYKNTI